jgi:hypothetical protein
MGDHVAHAGVGVVALEEIVDLSDDVFERHQLWSRAVPVPDASAGCSGRSPVSLPVEVSCLWWAR